MKSLLQTKLTQAEAELVENLKACSVVSAVPKALSSEQRILSVLENPTNKTVPNYSWVGSCRIALLLDIIDGDTIKVAMVDRNCVFSADGKSANVVQISVRLYGIDCAETRPRLDNPDRDEIKVLAARATDRLAQLLDTKLLHLYFMEHDKYGRPLAIVKPYKGQDSACIACSMTEAWQSSCNKQMLDEGLALPYSGGTKWSFNDAASHYRLKQTRDAPAANRGLEQSAVTASKQDQEHQEDQEVQGRPNNQCWWRRACCFSCK